MRPIFTLILALLTMPAFAADTACSLKDQYWISSELPRLKTWKAIHESFQKFTPQCDDGFIGEGYTDVVVVLLSHHWSSLPGLAALVRGDTKFEKFILRHINASADADDLKQLLMQSEKQCPPKHKAICLSIHSATHSAIKEL